MERCKALEALYQHVSDKYKLNCRTAVVAYEEAAEGIIVSTTDGAQYHGHMLIGAHGIHSQVRKLMADKVSETNELLAEEINQGIFALTHSTESSYY